MAVVARMNRRIAKAGILTMARLGLPAIFLAGTLVTNSHGLVVVIWAWLFTLAAAVVIDRPKRPYNSLSLVTTLYMAGAGLLYSYAPQLVFPPFPEGATILHGTRLSIQAILLAYLLVNSLLWRFDWTTWLRAISQRAMRAASRVSRVVLVGAAVTLYTVGALDWVAVFNVGLDEILRAWRRTYADHLVSASSNVVQVVGIAFSVVILLRLLSRRRSSVRELSLQCFLLGAVVSYWAAYLVVGARRELLLVLVPVAVVGLSSGYPNHRKVVSRLGIVTLAALVALPGVLAHDPLHSALEFVLPQYVLFAALEGDVVPEYSFATGAWFLLPRMLRLNDVSTLADQFKRAAITTVGYGFHPVAEAWILSPSNAPLVFAGITAALSLSIVGLSRISPAFGLVGVGILLIWGRYDFWMAAVSIIHIGGLAGLLLAASAQSIGGQPGGQRCPGSRDAGSRAVLGADLVSWKS